MGLDVPPELGLGAVVTLPALGADVTVLTGLAATHESNAHPIWLSAPLVPH